MFYHWLMEALFHHRAFVFSGHFCPKTLGSTKMELGHFPTCSCGLLCPISIWIFRWGFQEQPVSLFPCSGWPASHASKRPDYSELVTLFVNLTFFQTFSGACLVHRCTWKITQVVLSPAGQLWSPQSFSEVLAGIPGTKQHPVLNTD